MSLPTHYRLQVENATGVALDVSEGTDVTIQQKRQGLNTDGSWQDEAEGEIFNLAADLAGGAFAESAAQDHAGATNRWLGAQFEIDVTFGAGAQTSPNGDVNVRLQVSTDGGTTWPDDGEGMLLYSENFTAVSTSKRRNPVIGVTA